MEHLNSKDRDEVKRRKVSGKNKIVEIKNLIFFFLFFMF